MICPEPPGSGLLWSPMYGTVPGLAGLCQPTTRVQAGEKQIRDSGVHLNPLGLFLRTSVPCMWSNLSAYLLS